MGHACRSEECERPNSASLGEGGRIPESRDINALSIVGQTKGMRKMENAALLDLEQLGDEMFEVVQPETAGDTDANSAWAYACCHSASSSCRLS